MHFVQYVVPKQSVILTEVHPPFTTQISYNKGTLWLFQFLLGDWEVIKGSQDIGVNH